MTVPLDRQRQFLTKAEALELVVKAQAGDLDARNELIVRNIGLIVMVLRKYKYNGIEFGDLVNEGVFGIIEAIEKFDTALNVKFGTYAVWWIKNYINLAIITKSSVVKVSSHTIEHRAKWRKAKQALLTEKSRPCNHTEIAQKAGLTPLQAETMSKSFKARHYTQLKEHVQTGPKRSRQDKLDLELELLSHSLNKLDQKSQQIIRLRYGINNEQHTLAQIGRLLGVSRERVRQLQLSAENKIKRAFAC